MQYPCVGQSNGQLDACQLSGRGSLEEGEGATVHLGWPADSPIDIHSKMHTTK